MEQLNFSENSNQVDSWTHFQDNNEKLNQLRLWGLISKKALEEKPFYYCGIYSKNQLTPIEVIGYENTYIAVIELFGKPHKIHIDYLKEMQPTRKEVEQINEPRT